MTSLRFRILFMFAFSLLTSPLLFAQGENLLKNPSFEEPVARSGAAWQTLRWNGTGEFESLDTAAKTGSKSISVSSEPGADYSFTQKVKLNPYARYTLSGWIKTENVQKKTGQGALLNVHEINGARTEAVVGTKDWTKVECTFETNGQDEVQINCLFGGWGTATGKAYFDDISLVLVSILPVKGAVPEDWAPTVSIDVTKKAEPLNPLIYSQFIEHLGRCIYGGIWAEMLEDRKFHDPVNSKDSPWKTIADTTEIVMDKENPFVGEHTPKLILKENVVAGITQGGLMFKKDQKYLGYVWLKYEGDVESFSMTLTTTPGGSIPKITFLPNPHAVSVKNGEKGEYFKHEFELEVSSATRGEISLCASGKSGSVHIGTVSIMPADNVKGMRADTLKLLKELDSPLYRWPGGNFVSGYDWKDGIGDRDRRPPRKNPAWKGIEHNDFGLDEFMLFCRELNTEAYIAVNTGNGQVENALAELEYTNGSVETPMGKLRAENGHPEPYNVKWWGIGNEMYGNWQIGHMPVLEYVKKNNAFVDAFRKVDPTLHLIAVGEAGKWDEAFLPGAAEHLDSISEHFYVFQPKENVTEHVQTIPGHIRRIADAHRKYRKEMPELAGKDIRIAMDEWNYWYGPTPFGELGTRYFVKDGLGIAAGLHEFARNSEMFIMANYAQTVNVIGCIKTNATDAQFETTGLVLKLYRKEFGSIPVQTNTLSELASPLDVQAMVDPEGKTLSLGLVNPLAREVKVTLDSGALKSNASGKRFEIADPENDPKAHNDPGKPQRIDIVESDCTLNNGTITLKPYSVTLLKFEL